MCILLWKLFLDFLELFNVLLCDNSFNGQKSADQVLEIFITLGLIKARVLNDGIILVHVTLQDILLTPLVEASDFGRKLLHGEFLGLNLCF